ncbi:hypothetical protein FA15DRAFT_550717, partial [Coprinopsis marcescibilis]
SPCMIPLIVPPTAADSPAATSAHDIITKIELDVQEAKDSLTDAKPRQAYYVNHYRGPEIPYSPG